jgi:hypothetical protein
MSWKKMEKGLESRSEVTPECEVFTIISKIIYNYVIHFAEILQM